MTKTVERGWLGRLFGLPPKVYVCQSVTTGRWYERHEEPLWVVGFYGRDFLPCFRCHREVIPNNTVPSASAAYGRRARR